MKDLSLGTELVGPEGLPCVAVSKVMASHALRVSSWLKSSESTLLVDLSGAATATLSVGPVAPQSTVIAGGTLRAQDAPEARAGLRALRTALAERLDALGLTASGIGQGEARPPLEMDVRRAHAAFEALGNAPRSRALVVLSTREEFPDRQTLCATLEAAMHKLMERDDAARFAEQLPWRDEPYAALRSGPQRQMDRFLRFLQEYGMARVRLRTAFAWMEALCRAIPDDNPQQRIGLRYVQALETLVRAAEAGQLPAEVSVGSIGVIRTLALANVDFVSKLPLVPRADCEVGEHEDPVARRGLDAARTRARPSGRETRVLLRHVTWLPKFHASGPGLLPGRYYSTTLHSRAIFLREALRDGRFEGKKPTSEAERERMLRALEQHLVVRAAMRVALGRSTRPIEELDEAFTWLRSPSRREAAVRGVVHGFLSGAMNQPPLEASLEALAAAFAAHAGRCGQPARTLDFTVTLDDDLFEPTARLALRAARADDGTHSLPAWEWMRRLQVRDGDVLSPHAFSVAVRVSLDPIALSWKDDPIPWSATRGAEKPLSVVLTHAQPLGLGSTLGSLVHSSLGVSEAAVVVFLPRLGPEGIGYIPEEGSPEPGSIHRVSGAVLVGAEALRAIVRRVDPEGLRSLCFLTVFDRSRGDDLLDDAGLKAMARALESSFSGRAVYSQGICRDPASEGSPEAKTRRGGTRGAMAQHAPLSLAVPPGEDGRVGILVMAGRPVDCVRNRSGRPASEDAGNDLIWGEGYLAERDGPTLTLSSRGRLCAVLRREHDWPGAITDALGDLRARGCRHVVLVTHRAFERSTWRSESRNRLYDGELPLTLLARQPVCEGLTLVSMLCDTITGISADPKLGKRPSEARLLVADGGGLYGSEILGGALRPFVAVATNRAPFCQIAEGSNGRRRVGLRRRIHVYLERGAEGRPWLSGTGREQVREALVGIHLFESEGVMAGREGLRPVLAPVLLPHRVFDVERRCDAAELLWRKDHKGVWLNLVALAATGQRLAEGERGAP